MVANNLLEIYTLLFGWNMYESIWDVLLGSGLALVPFLVAVISNFRDQYEHGDAETAIKALEFKVISIILVLMFCVIPFKANPIQLSTVQYNLEMPDCHPPPNTKGQGNNTATAYDNSFTDMNSSIVHQPLAWSLVSYLSTAITHTVISSMECVNNYEFMLMRISQITIQDPKLRQRVRDFHEVCYKKALLLLEESPLVIPNNISPVNDVDWIGSRTLLNAPGKYYQEAYMSKMSRYGFSRQETVRASDDATKSDANPYCREVWQGEEGPGGVNNALGLRQLLLNDIPADDAGDILDDWRGWGSQVVTVGATEEEFKEDLIIKMILQADALNLKSQTDVNLSNNFDTNKSWGKNLVDKVFGGAGMLTSIDEFLKANTVKQLAKVAGPMILALIQMVVIIAAPFVLLFGRYEFSAFIGIALVYFSFEFINAIWAASYWFDNRVLDIYMSQAGWFDIATNSFLVSSVSAGSVIFMPLIWLSIIAYSGGGMVRGMAAGGVGGGVAAGSGAFNGASGRAGMGAYKAWRSRGRRN